MQNRVVWPVGRLNRPPRKVVPFSGRSPIIPFFFPLFPLLLLFPTYPSHGRYPPLLLYPRAAARLRAYEAPWWRKATTLFFSRTRVTTAKIGSILRSAVEEKKGCVNRGGKLYRIQRSDAMPGDKIMCAHTMGVG